MTDSPAAQAAGEALGTLICLLVVAAIDSDVQWAHQQELERRARPRFPLRRHLDRVLRWFTLNSPAQAA
jgi:hypothetical protein